MKKIFYLLAFSLLGLQGACTDHDEQVASMATAPEVTGLSIANGSTNVATDPATIAVTTTAPVVIPNPEAVTLTAANGQRIALTATVANKNIYLAFAQLESNTDYTLSIPAGALCNSYDSSLCNTTAATTTFTTAYDAPTSVTVTPADAPVDAAATAATKALYSYVRNSLFLGGKMAVGTMAKYTVQFTESDWVYEKTGKYPAIHCFDLMNLTGKEYLEDYADLVPNATAWHNEKGIVAVMWHWRDPSKVSNDFYTEGCTFDLRKIVASANGDGTYTYDTQSDEYKAIMGDIAAAKAQLQKLADAGIPVLWRPLHEARGGWFWWGNAGADACKALWMLLRREMSDLHNLIWVWTVQVDSDFRAAQQWYPGDANLDIVGVDIYESAHSSFAAQYKFAAEVGNLKKIVALSECGAMPDVDKMQAEGAAWAYCMPWCGEHTESITYNGIKYWQKMLTGDFADRVIDRSEVTL